MIKRSLREFDPNMIAVIETSMWQAYYRHQFPKLFLLLLKLTHVHFHLNYIQNLKAAFYSASAAIDFRRNRGKENKERITEKLTHFYKVISEHAIENFDYKKAAELECEWWFIDRYPESYSVSRREALARAMAILYQVNPLLLMEYADYRARAMELQDKAEVEKKEADWDKVTELLQYSYKSLHSAVQ